VRQRTVLSELLQATAELVARTLRLEVVLDLPTPGTVPPPIVEADANQLQQALVNLALNARDAVRRRKEEAGPGVPLPDERILFRLRHVVVEGELPAFPHSVPAGDYAVLEVQDSGCGMTSEVLNQALDPFYTTKDVGQGTGLGLPMVFGIVQGHHGHLTIESEPGQGTCVALYLSRLIDAPQPARAGANVGAFGPDVFESEVVPGKSILVIDDEEAVLDVVRRFLQIAGHGVTCATSAAAALGLLANGQSFDLTILDLMMPREDAVVTFQRLQSRRPGMPVLLCTGLAESGPAPQLLRAGAAGILRKPFRMNELWYAVKEALQQE
jgi:CheY-like chemotaxis protein